MSAALRIRICAQAGQTYFSIGVLLSGFGPHQQGPQRLVGAALPSCAGGPQPFGNVGGDANRDGHLLGSLLRSALTKPPLLTNGMLYKAGDSLKRRSPCRRLVYTIGGYQVASRLVTRLCAFDTGGVPPFLREQGEQGRVERDGLDRAGEAAGCSVAAEDGDGRRVLVAAEQPVRFGLRR